MNQPEWKKQPYPEQGLVGDEPALSRGGRSRAPDRRELSLRWLSGAFLTGLASTTLMGASLFVALDGKQLLATPPEVAPATPLSRTAYLQAEEAKTNRLFRAALPVEEPSDRRRMSVSTVTRVGDADVVRTKPFEYVQVALGADHRTNRDYPAFNPLNIFGDGESETADPLGSIIYGANVETEASIRLVDFDLNTNIADDSFALSNNEVEEIVRATSAILPDGGVEVASLNYVDPVRFGLDETNLTGIGLAAPNAVIVPQNISVSPQDLGSTEALAFTEDLLDISSTTDIATALEKTGYSGTADMARALSTLLKADNFKSSNTVRLGLQMLPGDTRIVRSSVYSGSDHVLTIALNDQEQFVPAPEPVDRGIMEGRVEREELAMLSDRDLPTAYDAIYRSILSYDLPKDMAAQIVRMVAADVDFQAPIKSTDRLSLFFSVPEEGEEEEVGHELLYVEASFNGQTRRFYRFGTDEGSDFFDEDGRSARQFLLRNPVPNGVFRSAYGMRRHPILRYSKMHWGVDWAAPRGTPIIAPGNGVVKKAGWSNGYGKQTIIEHPNGYETSYSHQSRFGDGIRPGVRVRQGQVIGYVGTTGLSTGPHLHYEMKVNGERVDPLRVRLPKGQTLSGEALAAFQKERERIDQLLGDPSASGTEVARLDG